MEFKRSFDLCGQVASFHFQLTDLVLISLNHGGHIGCEEPIGERGNFLADSTELSLKIGFLLVRVSHPRLPEVREERLGKAEKPLAGFEASRDLKEAVFHIIAADGFKAEVATLSVADIVRVLLIFAFAPSAGELMATGGAIDVAAQGKVLRDGFLTRGDEAAAFEPRFRCFPGLRGD